MLRSWRRRWLAAVRRRLRPLSVDAGLATEPDAAPAEDSGEEDDVAWAEDFCDDDECLALARMIFGEARGESFAGKVAVAWSVRNRVLRPSWWGDTVKTVVHRKWQYSCFSTGPHRAAVEAFPHDVKPGERKAAFDCMHAAAVVLAGTYDDPTEGATHYLTTSLLRRKPPAWATAEGARQTVQIEQHVFFTGVR